MASASSAKVKEVRKEYEAVKRLYKTTGKKAFGKAKSSEAYKDYREVKRAYKKIGGQLGKLTKLKPR
jgi:hypothetical protein